jgi:lactate permease
MPWNQVIDPLNNFLLSALVASLPIVFIFWALIIKKLKGYQASILAAVIAILISIVVYGMPAQLALLSTAHGAMYGLFPICWIIIPAVFLFNITVKSGQFEIIKYFMASVTSDRRIQALLIAFSFGSFLEGTAGFGTPVAITAAMLVGLGFNPLYAAGICLIANTAPVAFGSIGIPITVASQFTKIPEMAISQMVGRTLPLLSLVLPFYLVALMAGFKKAMEVLPAILVSGISFAFFQWLTSNYLGPMLPDIIAGLASIICLLVFLKFWKPKTIWRFKEEPAPVIHVSNTHSTGQIIRALSPFLMLTAIILAWGLQPVKDLLNSIGLLSFNIPGLHDEIVLGDGSVLHQNFKLNYLSTPGTAILITALLSFPLVGMRFSEGVKIFIDTIKQLRFAILTIAAVMGFAYMVNNSGISNTLAAALANTGILFPFFAPFLGWLGVFITGSDTSSNALFGKLQSTTATSIGVDPVVTVSANVSGGVVGKMISPQSIAVAAAAGNLIGKESALFRFTVKHSFILLFAVAIITTLQAYVITWIIPEYSMLEDNVAVGQSASSTGLSYLLILAVVLTVLMLIVLSIKRKNR